MNYITPNKETHEYILGIDFGHGETSADYCNIQWSDSHGSLKIPDSIQILPGRPNIKSVLLLEEKNGNTNYYIGEQAISRYENPKYHKDSEKYLFYSYFKKVPSLMSDSEKDIMCSFMSEVYKQIRRQLPQLTDENHIVYIACPSNSKIWTQQEMKSYVDIALQAGIPIAKINDESFGIIRESRAAFLKARFDEHVKSCIKDGVLLIDFGSSTVDLTYYSSKIDKPIDDGSTTCGASKIEQTISKDLSEQFTRVQDAINLFPSAETAINLQIRKNKEEFYTSDMQDFYCNLPLAKYTAGQILESVDKYYQEDEIDDILKEYKNEITDCFLKFKKEYIKDKPIKLIFMTGGASNMGFVKNIAQSVFSNNAEFYKETNPSLTISNGIALAGRADLRAEELMLTLLNHDNVKKNEAFAGKVVDECVDRISSRIISDIADEYNNFENGDFTQVATLESKIKSAVNYIGYSTIISQVFKEKLISEVNESVIPKLNLIVGNFFPDEKIEQITSDRTFSSNITVSDTLNSCISSSMNAMSEGFFEASAKVIGNIIGFFMAIYLAMLEKVGTAIYDILKGNNVKRKTFDQIVDENLEELLFKFRNEKTTLNSSQRQKVNSDFKSKKEGYKLDIKSTLRSEFNSNSSFKSSVNKAYEEAVTQYIKEQISTARLMLN